MHRNFTRENREALLVIRRKRTDRWAKAMSYKAHMNDNRDSSGGIVPTKRSNEDQGGSKGNRGGKAAGRGDTQPSRYPHRTPCRTSGPTMAEGRAQRRLFRLQGVFSKVGTVCVRSASTVLCGGRSAMIVPTATMRRDKPA
jgi:hypothetical protein